LLKYKYKN